jgi:probable phosphoglycerate mutase
MTQIIIVRHGESFGNKSKLICGWHDSKLTDLGKQQAKKVGIALKEIGIDKFISSDLTRAKETSSIISTEIGLSFELDQRLRERNCGILDGMPVEQAIIHPDWENLIGNPLGKVQGAESTQELSDRAGSFLMEIAQKFQDKTVLLSTHGGMLWVMVPFVLGVKLEHYNGLIGMDNCGVSVIAHSKGQFALRCLNITTHMGKLFDGGSSWEF